VTVSPPLRSSSKPPGLLGFLLANRIDTHLVFVYFVADRADLGRAGRVSPVDEAGWQKVLAEQDEHVGLPAAAEIRGRIHKVFPPTYPSNGVRQRVLVGKETVVRVQSDVGPPFQRLGQQERTELSGEARRNGLLEEDPDVSATSRSRPLDGGRQAASAAGIRERLHVLLPPILVEVDGQEEAAFVLQHRVDARHERLAGVVAARQMPPDDVVADGKAAAGSCS
jgi:hypothetical protein